VITSYRTALMVGLVRSLASATRRLARRVQQHCVQDYKKFCSEWASPLGPSPRARLWGERLCRARAPRCVAVRRAHVLNRTVSEDGCRVAGLEK
jgi:hypothetical protein